MQFSLVRQIIDYILKILNILRGKGNNYGPHSRIDFLKYVD